MSTERTNPKLWERVKKEVQDGDSYGKTGTWNARKAQFAVKQYKMLVGGYIGSKKPTNSLVKWTKESWGYIDNKSGNRYLPLEVRNKLSPKEKLTENRLKRSATKANIGKAKYSKSVLKKMQKLT